MQDYYYFLVDGFTEPLGYVYKTFVEQMPWPDYWTVDREKRLVKMNTGTDFDSRTRLMHETVRVGIESPDVALFTGWDDEMFAIYAADGEHIMNMDGMGLDGFGVVNFAVHMIGFVRGKDGSTKYWVPRRAKTKATYPNMLDNTVGGSLSAGEKPIDCMVRECEEELCLDREYTRANLLPCGAASYAMDRADDGKPSCQHQVQYLYEMELAESIVPKIGDGEVGEVNLLTIDEVKAALANGEFKLNCAISWIAFMIRHGHISSENEPNFLEICARLHRKHDLFIL